MPPGDQDMSRHERVNRQRLIEMTKGWIAYNKNLFPEGKAGEAVTAAVGAITSGAIRDEKTLMQYFRDLMQTPTRLESDQIAANRPRGGSGREPNYYSQGANQALGILRADPAIKERWMLAESAERSLEAYLKNPTSSAAQAKFQRDFALAMNKGTLTDKDATAPEQYQSWLQRTQKWLSVGLEGKLPQWQLDEMVAILRTGLERTYREQEGEFNSQIDGGQYMAEQPITMRQGWASKMHEIHGRRKYFNADAVKRIANGAADPGQVTVDDAPATGGAPAPGKPLSAGAQGLLNRMRGK